MKVSKVIVPIAGLGTRMLPATKAIPKEMLPIVNKPIIQIIIEEPVEEPIRSEPEIIYPKLGLERKKKSKVTLEFDEPDYTWDIL